MLDTLISSRLETRLAPSARTAPRENDNMSPRRYLS